MISWDSGVGPILTPGPSRFTVIPEVIVRDVLIGVGIEQTDITGRLVRFRVNASLDNSTISASVTFRTGPTASSLSPLVTASSYFDLFPNGPVLRPNNALELRVTIPNFPDIPEAGGASFRIFMGRIDRVTVGANGQEVTVTCRDMGGYLLNGSIETAVKRGSLTGQPAQDVINEIHAAAGFSDLSVLSGIPGFDILEYPQEEMAVLEADRRIAQQFGWDVRWFPTEGSGITVRLYDPGRDRTTSDLTIGKGRYQSIEELAWGDEDVRNVWDVYWQNEAGLPQGPVHVEDAVSIAKYRRRYARIFLQRAENIRNETNATNFANAALADSKDPFASHVIRAPLLPMIELNDLHTYQANDVHYDEDQQFCVVAYTHEYAKGHGTTTIGARGRPIAAYREYRKSVPPKILGVTTAPTAEYAPEGTLAVVVGSLAFPV